MHDEDAESDLQFLAGEVQVVTCVEVVDSHQADGVPGPDSTWESPRFTQKMCPCSSRHRLPTGQSCPEPPRGQGLHGSDTLGFADRTELTTLARQDVLNA